MKRKDIRKWAVISFLILIAIVVYTWYTGEGTSEELNCEEVPNLLTPQEKNLVYNDCSCFQPGGSDCEGGYDIYEIGLEYYGSTCGCCGDYDFCKYEARCHHIREPTKLVCT